MYDAASLIAPNRADASQIAKIACCVLM